jgi:N-acetylglucosamine kinase-like BadF-type ATPase
MNFYLGFDGGGTKTHCVVVDDAGHIVAEARSGPSNPLRVGFAKSCATLEDAATQALTSAGIERAHIQGVCAGLAGASQTQAAQRIAEFLKNFFPQAAVEVTTDLEIALAAAVGAGEGIVLIAGTGSAAYGRNAAGKSARAGGEGPEKGDRGSAYDIGKRAVEAVVRTRSEQGPGTTLVDQILAALSCSSWEQLNRRIAQDPDDVFPRLFPVVADAAASGDGIARDLLTEAATALADLATRVADALGVRNLPCTIAKVGGVFSRSALLDRALESQITHTLPLAHIVPWRVSPAHAAAETARARAARQ